MAFIPLPPLQPSDAYVLGEFVASGSESTPHPAIAPKSATIYISLSESETIEV